MTEMTAIQLHARELLIVDALEQVGLNAYSIKLKQEELDLLRKKRVELFVYLRSHDITYREIAQACGLTLKRVQEIVPSVAPLE